MSKMLAKYEEEEFAMQCDFDARYLNKKVSFLERRVAELEAIAALERERAA